MARQVKVPVLWSWWAALAGGTTLGNPGAVMAVPPRRAPCCWFYREVILPHWTRR